MTFAELLRFSEKHLLYISVATDAIIADFRAACSRGYSQYLHFGEKFGGRGSGDDDLAARQVEKAFIQGFVEERQQWVEVPVHIHETNLPTWPSDA